MHWTEPATSDDSHSALEKKLWDSVDRFDFVMANPPCNVSKIDKGRLASNPRYPFGVPRTDNGNYLWIQHFHSALNKKGRAGFVMANSAADARASEQEIREKIILAGHVGGWEKN